MNKSRRIKKVIGFACALIVLVVLLFACDIFVWDHSAIYADGHIYWNNHVYVMCSGDYSEKKTIARTSDNWNINEIAEDKSRTFIVARSFLDQYLFVREDYPIPKGGTITAVSWNLTRITDPSFCEAISKIYMSSGKTFEYETEGIFMLTDRQHMRSLYVAYENCPVATEYLGYMGKINDVWAITVEISTDTYNENGSRKRHTVTCKEIPDEYSKELEKYFS